MRLLLKNLVRMHMIMHVINSLIRLKFLLVITGVFVGCSQQTIPLAVLDKESLRMNNFKVKAFCA